MLMFIIIDLINNRGLWLIWLMINYRIWLVCFVCIRYLRDGELIIVGIVLMRKIILVILVVSKVIVLFVRFRLIKILDV